MFSQVLKVLKLLNMDYTWYQLDCYCYMSVQSTYNGKPLFCYLLASHYSLVMFSFRSYRTMKQ